MVNAATCSIAFERHASCAEPDTCSAPLTAPFIVTIDAFDNNVAVTTPALPTRPDRKDARRILGGHRRAVRGHRRAIGIRTGHRARRDWSR